MNSDSLSLSPPPSSSPKITLFVALGLEYWVHPVPGFSWASKEFPVPITEVVDMIHFILGSPPSNDTLQPLCASGSVFNASMDSCIPCSPGTYHSSYRDQCIDCPRGRYNPNR
mgnify:CR=1 FL=1